MASVDIGKKLKEARLQQNMSLDELQQITKTQKRYLIAIEENDFDSMPGTFYVRAFIRQYASAVGLDGNELVRIYDGKEEPEEIAASAKYETLDESRTQMYDENSQTKKLSRSIPAIAFSLIGLAILVVVLYITWQDRQSNPVIQTPDSVANSTRSSVSSSTVSETSASTTDSSTTTSTSAAKPATEVKFDSESGTTVNMSATNIDSQAKLELTAATSPCWVGIYITTAANNDNGYFYQQTIQPGTPQSVDIPAGTTQIVISLGASEYMQMKLNGQSIGFNPNNTGIGPRTINMSLAYTQ